MKKVFVFCLCVFIFLLITVPITYIAVKKDFSPIDERTVYVTNTGECYHAKSCGSLKYSSYSTTIASAERAGFRACKRCNPRKNGAGRTALALTADGIIAVPTFIKLKEIVTDS